MLAKPFHCHDCGSHEAYRSRPRNVIERFVLPLLYLRAVRCGDCFRRSYQLSSVAIQERPLDSTLTRSGGKAAAKSVAA